MAQTIYRVYLPNLSVLPVSAVHQTFNSNKYSHCKQHHNQYIASLFDVYVLERNDIAIISIELMVLSIIIDAQSCVDTVNFRQRGIFVSYRFTDSQVIVPRSNFSCDGRITGYQIRVEEGRSRNYPIVQVWRPTSSTTFTWVDNLCPLSDDITLMEDGINDEYYIGNVSCTGNNTIEFQSGDVIGYYNGRRRFFYRLQSIQTIGYTSYLIEDIEYDRDFENNDLLTSFNIDDPDVVIVNDTQPLIQVMFGKINN